MSQLPSATLVDVDLQAFLPGPADVNPNVLGQIPTTVVLGDRHALGRLVPDVSVTTTGWS